MGEVFKAHDSNLDRPVALKILPADLGCDPDRLRRFHAEARGVSSLNHPNILIVHDFGEVDGRPFMVTEFVEGETLRDRVGRGPLMVGDALDIVTQVAAALAAAHARGIVHRDIKPENVMVRPDGYVKVLDFGLLKLMPSQSSNLDLTRTEPGRVLGTPRYMSPEQARGLDADPRSDVWSVGVLLYEMLAGRPPFIGLSSADVIAAILHSDPVPVSAHSSQVPESVSRILATTLAKDASLRYDSGATLRAALAGVRHADVPGEIATATSTRAQVMVGREAQRNEMLAAFRRVVGGRGEVLSISGEPGAGKTTLAEHFLRAVHTIDPRCLIGRGRCSERLAGAEAYLPVLEALDMLVRSDARSNVAEHIKAVAPSWYSRVCATAADGESVPERASSQERLKREMTAMLRDLSRAHPVVLLFEDVHWADASTVDLLAYLAARFDELRTLIVTTSRPSDLSLTNHPFIALRRELQARHLCHEIELGMLTLTEVEQYLAAEYGDHRFSPAFAELVHAKTEGSPLFMSDLVRYLANKSTIAEDSEGRWTLRGSLAAIGAELPESVRAMIDRKIAQLSEDDRALLAAASVQGYEFDSAVIERVLADHPADIDERLEAVDRKHRFITLVDERELPDGTLSSRYRFVHVLYQNALFGQLRPKRRVTLSAAVAGALTQSHGPRDVEIATELAALYEAARNNLRAAHYCRVATQHAAQLFASQEALALGKRGLALLEGAPSTRERQETELGLLITLGNAFIALRGYSSGEVLETYTRALAVSEQLGETRDRAAVLYGFTAFHLVGGRHPQALSHARAMLAFTDRLQHPAAIVAHRLVGWALLAMGRAEEALPHFEKCGATYDPAKHAVLAYSFGQEPGMAARVLLAVNLQVLGRSDDARRACNEALAMSRRTTHANSRCYVLHFGSMYAQMAGERDLAREYAEQALHIAAEQGLALWTGWSRITRGWALADGGDLETGIAEMRCGIDVAHALGNELCHSYYLALLAEMLVRAGRNDEALAALDETDRMINENQERIWEPRIRELRKRLVANSD